MKNFHCCASCVNYEVKKENGKMIYRCSRLGFDTKPTYQFNCWDPKEAVKKLMGKDE
ncbi:MULTISPECIES: hypothetical protein [Bacillaceae]|uniref:hypothetical protein n=1 Tax=Robertmurraya sp. TaxID=2837525 RepID=UPI0013C523D1|nr:hypothetical protein [Bacillus sp. Y1]